MGTETPSAPMTGALPLWPEVYGFALQLTGDRTRAEDLSQEAFARLHRARRPLDSAAVLRPYLFRIVRNLTHDAMRRPREAEIDESTVAGRSDLDPVTEVSAAEDRAAIRAALLEMKPIWRAVLYLRDALDHRYEEIAEILGLTEDAVRMTLHRARARLRGRLASLDAERRWR